MLKDQGDGPHPDFKNPRSTVNAATKPRRLSGG